MCGWKQEWALWRRKVLPKQRNNKAPAASFYRFESILRMPVLVLNFEFAPVLASYKEAGKKLRADYLAGYKSKYYSIGQRHGFRQWLEKQIDIVQIVPWWQITFEGEAFA